MNLVLRSLAIVGSLIAALQAMEEEVKNPVNDFAFPKEVEIVILKMATTGNLPEFTYAQYRNKNRCLESVCKRWYDIIVKDPTVLAYNLTKNDDAEYQACLRHLKGKVIFMKDTPIERVLRFADLNDPFRGEFDLSMCIHPVYGKMDRQLRMLNGSRETAEDKCKIEIRFTPLFWIKKELQNGKSLHLRHIYMDENGHWKDNADVGIYVLCAKHSINEFACVTTENCLALSSKSLGDVFFTSKNGISFNKMITAQAPYNLVDHISQRLRWTWEHPLMIFPFSCSLGDLK